MIPDELSRTHALWTKGGTCQEMLASIAGNRPAATRASFEYLYMPAAVIPPDTDRGRLDIYSACALNLGSSYVWVLAWN
jgi:hypothetical protein